MPVLITEPKSTSGNIAYSVKLRLTANCIDHKGGRCLGHESLAAAEVAIDLLVGGSPRSGRGVVLDRPGDLKAVVPDVCGAGIVTAHGIL